MHVPIQSLPYEAEVDVSPAEIACVENCLCVLLCYFEH